MSKINIKDVLKRCDDYLNGKMSEDKFKIFLESLNISKRLSMFKKNSLIDMAMLDYDDISPIEGAYGDSAIEMESIYINRFLMAYIELSYEPYSYNENNIEILYESGFVDFVLDLCEKDYNMLIRMFDNAINIKYISSMHNIIFDITSKENADNVNKISDIFKDKHAIDSVVKILEANDPALQDIKKSIYSMDKK